MAKIAEAKLRLPWYKREHENIFIPIISPDYVLGNCKMESS